MSTTTKSAIQTASLYALEKVRELSASAKTRDTLQAAEARAVPVEASSVTRSVAQVDLLAHLAYTRAAPSTDSRYVQFVEAVRALRVDLDLSSLSRAQIDRIMESAARMYLINDGIPEPVEPPPIEPPANPDIPAGPGSKSSEDKAAETKARWPEIEWPVRGEAGGSDSAGARVAATESDDRTSREHRSGPDDTAQFTERALRESSATPDGGEQPDGIARSEVPSEPDHLARPDVSATEPRPAAEGPESEAVRQETGNASA